jgi:hypothetical protein
VAGSFACHPERSRNPSKARIKCASHIWGLKRMTREGVSIAPRSRLRVRLSLLRSSTPLRSAQDDAAWHATEQTWGNGNFVHYASNASEDSAKSTKSTERKRGAVSTAQDGGRAAPDRRSIKSGSPQDGSCGEKRRATSCVADGRNSPFPAAQLILSHRGFAEILA